MKVVYIAGPISGPTQWDVKKNIQKAEDLALEVWKTKKASAICPHTNTAHWGAVLTHQEFLDGDLEMLKRCDAVLMVPGWEKSKGAVQEYEFALAHGVMVFKALESLMGWLGVEVKK